MKIFESIDPWLNYRKSQLNETIGFVPTMGALHEGHLSLIQASQRENSRTVVSIYVNPTQFNDPKDLDFYPSDLSKDIEKLKDLKVDALLLPRYSDIYPDNFTYKVQESHLSAQLCGKNRPGHFDGVLTVVMKLFNIVAPQKAYFGHKDYQQFLLITKMVEAFFMPIEVVGCPTKRESTGLAMSSRNRLLSLEEKQIAPQLYSQLSSSNNLQEVESTLTSLGFEVDYLEEIENRRFIAATLGSVRLIDNVEI